MLFLLGAGFNIDANQEAGPISNSYDGSAIPCGYPMVAPVLKLSFGLDEAPEGKSVEDLFARALEVCDFKPMEALVDRLMEADYYIAWKGLPCSRDVLTVSIGIESAAPILKSNWNPIEKTENVKKPPIRTFLSVLRSFPSFGCDCTV